MKKKRYIALTLILSLLCMNKAYATCTQEAKDEFDKIKNEYKITTTFDSATKSYIMKIQEAKPDKFGYVFDIDYEYECKEISNTVTECTGLKDGTSFTATVMGVTNECSELVREDFIRLEKYNQFYEDPLCEGIEEFALCQEIYDREIDRETFEQRVKYYKESKQEKIEEEQKKQEEEKDVLNKTTSYAKENPLQIIIIIVFIVLVIISSIIGYKYIRKSRRLE